ncbi:MAG: mersacidin/lichenicidin family type 2 lantibiotic [Rivularia sp. (in: Bacteria)]|nr:mersacidin/lichenicidin family type 2 lantibiotic [Rivularia sp. MS3]
MSNIDIIRAWKDEEYRNSLSEEQLSQLPENPAGLVELSNSDMESITGGLYTSNTNVRIMFSSGITCTQGNNCTAGNRCSNRCRLIDRQILN